MSFWFTIREGIKGFGRARLATTLTITSVAFSHLLIGIFIVFSINVDYLISDLRSQMEFEVYLEPTLPVSRTNKIEKEIQAMDGVASVTLISPIFVRYTLLPYRAARSSTIIDVERLTAISVFLLPRCI